MASCINHCGWLSQWFPLNCGIRQGCPLSPLCFILACEILACKIRQCKSIKGIKLPADIYGRNEIKLLQYADDSTIFVSDENSIIKCLHIITLFSRFSGLTLNKNKTEAIWLGCWKNRKKEIANLKWKTFPDNNIKILGIQFKNDCSIVDISQNWESKITKCERIIKSWLGRNLTIMGKIVLAKTFLISQFIYLMQGCILSKKVLKRINTLIYKFIWCKKCLYKEDDLKRVTERMNRCTMNANYTEGGLNMIDMETLQMSLAFKWIKRIVEDGNGIWRSIPKHYLMSHGPKYIIFKINMNNPKNAAKNEPRFYKTLLTLWLSIKNKNPKMTIENSSQIIWNNQDFKYRNNTINCKRWINNGIYFVSDVIKDTGIVPYQNIVTQLGDGAMTMFEYNILRNAIKQSTQGKNIWPEKDHTIYLNNMPLSSHTTKSISTFINKQPETMKGHFHKPTIWILKFGEELIEKHWVLARHVTQETCLIILQWKILHDIYPTGEKLCRMKIEDNTKCKFCSEVKDDITHFFYHCPYIKNIWNAVQSEIEIMLRVKRPLTPKEIMLGVYDNIEKNMLKQTNRLILVAKRCIVLSKSGNSNNIQTIYKREKEWRQIAM